MLRHGLSTYEFSKIANIAFIQAAQDILHEQGKSPSFSRVSTITGLHRHVVSDIAKSAEANQDRRLLPADRQRGDREEVYQMNTGDGFELNQLTIGDLIVAVMDAALEVTRDESMAYEIASHVLMDILDVVSPGIARDMLAAYGGSTLH
jgi:hypothetical protein